MKEKIYVTRPSLPSLDHLTILLEKIWANRWITNGGEFVRRFEKVLVKHLGVDYLSLFCNGTTALQTGLKALGVEREVITTPFTFVATTHSILWNGCTPVFCDVEENSFNLDPSCVENAVGHNTQAILPVHLYGNPCNTDAFDEIANRKGLKLFYDAAHAFAVHKEGVSILNSGDLSMLSFHATKTFNTIEGGALVTADADLKKRLDFLNNFGFENEESVIGLGTNGKMNELQAAYGLLQLEIVEQEIARCAEIVRNYRSAFSEIEGIRFLEDIPGVRHNYSYFPVLVDPKLYGLDRDALHKELMCKGIYTRKYFYPLVSNFAPYREIPSAIPRNLPVANRLAQQVLCLPLYADLSDEQVGEIISAIGLYQ